MTNVERYQAACGIVQDIAKKAGTVPMSIDDVFAFADQIVALTGRKRAVSEKKPPKRTPARAAVVGGAGESWAG